MNDITTHEDDEFELADPITDSPKVIVDAGKKISEGQLSLINRKLEKMDELGAKLPTKFGKRNYGEYHCLSYAKADELIKAILKVVSDAHKVNNEIKRASAYFDNFLPLPRLSKYLFDPKSFRVFSKATGKPVRPVVTPTGVVVYDLYEDNKEEIVANSFERAEFSSGNIPSHTCKTVRGRRRKVSVANLYRLSIGWSLEDLDLHW